MRFAATVAVGLVLVYAGTASLRGQARAAGQDDGLPHGGGILRGHVTAAGTGLPVPGATVQALRTSLTASPVITVTDSEGAFELRGLTPGRWRLDAAKAGFIARGYGQRYRSGRVGTITLEDRAAVTANIALVRGGSVSGRIIDEFGDPAVNVRVQVMEVRAAENGGRAFAATGVYDVTDDRGHFRIFDLSAGDYIVTARPQVPFTRSAATGVERRVIVGTPGSSAATGLYLSSSPTYFPGTPDSDAAERVALGPGEELAGVDFALRRIVPVTMSGHILDSTGAQPAGQINVSLSRAVPDPGALYLAARPVSGDGYFEFRGVPPGSHVISVSTWRTDGQTEYASVPVTVVAEDVTGLTITTSPGVALNGTVVAQDGLLPDLHGVTVVAVPAGSARLQARITAVVDRQFLVPNLVGTFRLDLQGVPAGWTLLSIHVDGVDVTDEPVTFGSGEPHAVVTLTNRLTEIRGVVTRNRRPADAEVVVFPDDPAKWATQRFIRTTRVDEKGAFSLQGLPPHDSYLAVATDYVEPSELFDPEFLERLRARAVVFRLDDGQARRLPLTYVERSAIDGR